MAGFQVSTDGRFWVSPEVFGIKVFAVDSDAAHRRIQEAGTVDIPDIIWNWVGAI
jgi:hypothetical protein